MADVFYTPEELKAMALGAQTQPEFDPEAEPDDPEDTSWVKMQALFDRDAEIQAIIATITQPYPTVSGDDTVAAD